MDESDFVIRLDKKDYLKEIEGAYHVRNLIAQDNALKLIKNSKRFNKKTSPEVILNHFDELFSALYSDDIELYQLRDVYDTAISSLLFNLKDFLISKQKVQDPLEKRKTVNIIKRLFYIVHMFFMTYEDAVCKRTDNMVPELKKRKMPKASVKTPSVKEKESTGWNDIKRELFSLIFEVLSVEINAFWPSGVAEKNLIDLIGDLCYKAFENSEISQARVKHVRDKIALVLALLVARYHHGMAFFVKACDLMKHHEHVTSPVTASVLLMMTNYNCTTVMSNFLNELVGTMRAEDIPCLAKGTATLITDIAESSPELLMSSVRVLRKNLVLEPYFVRNATLVAFTEIILKRLTGNELNEEDRETREELLHYLMNHLRDQNSYARSKTIQLWTKLASSRAIPKDNIMPVLKTVYLLVNNTSAHVVKSAVQFFRVILKENPFAAKLDLREIHNQLALAKTALDVIQLKCAQSREELWRQLEAPLVLSIAKVIQNEADQTSSQVEESSQGENSVSVEAVTIIIAQLLEKRLFPEAYNLLRQSEKEFPKAGEIKCNLDKNDKVEYYTAVLKKIFLSAESPGTAELGNLHEELKKQRLVVEYMKESATFVKLMNEVTEEVALILKGKSLMEIMEAIEYFSVAFQFGLVNSDKTVRSLLSYVKCDQPGIKDAVADVYKTLYLVTNQPTEKARSIQIANRLIRLVKELTVEQASALEELIQRWMCSGDLSNDFVLTLLEKISNPNSDSETVRYSLFLLNMMVPKKKAILLSNINRLMKIVFEERSSDLPTVEQFCLMLCNLKSEKNGHRLIRYPPTHDLLKKPAAILIDCFTRIPVHGYVPLAVAAIRMIFSIGLYPERLTNDILTVCYKKLFSDDGKVNAVLLARLFHLYSETVYRKSLYLDKDVINTLKKSDSHQASNGKTPNGELDEDEDEENYNEQCVDDQLVNSVAMLCNDILMTEDKMNEHLAYLIVQVFKGPEVHALATQVAAATALTKLMLVSQKFCDNNIQLFVTLMEKSREESVRSVLVLGVGDLIYRWPNIVGPWSSHVYARLKDQDLNVRRNAVNVLCHLITREMIKVKGQMSEICLCLVDSDAQIVAQVRCLFEFLSQKGNTLYNLVPDIISRLSNPERVDPVPFNSFNTIMTFVFGLMGKERQNENLVEKLCCRITEATSDRQLKDLSLCLSLLNYNERSLKRLGDALPSLGDRLENHDVVSAVTNVVNVSSKSSKPAVKEAAVDVQAILNEIISGEPRKSKAGTCSNEDDSEDSDHFVKTPRKKTKAPVASKSPPTAKKTRYARNNKNGTSSNEDDSEDSDHFIKTPKKRTKAPTTSKSPPTTKKIRYGSRIKK